MAHHSCLLMHVKTKFYEQEITKNVYIKNFGNGHQDLIAKTGKNECKWEQTT